MQAHSSASGQRFSTLFSRDSLLYKLISVLVAWAMIMSSMPVYGSDQVHARWAQPRSALANPFPAAAPGGSKSPGSERLLPPVSANRGSLSSSSSSSGTAISLRSANVELASLHVPAFPGYDAHGSLLNGFSSGLFALPFQTVDSPLQISLAFADSSSASANFPEPWNDGNPLVNFVGGGVMYRAGAIRMDNPGSSAVTIDSVKVDLGRPGPVFQLWQNITVPAGGSAILTQTQDGNFNTSASPLVGCGVALDPSETRIPKISVTIAGTSTDYLDTAHVLDTGGFDSSCRGNQSLEWRSIGTTGIESPSGSLQLISDGAPHAVGTQDTVTVVVNDAANQPLANVPVDLTVLNGPNQGKSFSGVSDASGSTTIQYSSSLQGTDLIQAVVKNASTGVLQSQQTSTTWTSADVCPAPSAPNAAASALIYVGQTSISFGSAMRVSALLTDGTGNPLSGRTLAFTVADQNAMATTDANGIATLLESALPAGQSAVSVSFAGDQSYQAAQLTATVTVLPAATLLRYTGSNLITAQGQQTVSAVLTDALGRTAIAGRTLTFTLNGVTASAVTDANGSATATLNFSTALPTGAGQLQINFAGDASYQPSSRAVPVQVYQPMPFVIWGGNSGGLLIGQRVNFWGSQWESQVINGLYFGANPSFKGWSGAVASFSPCEANATLATLDMACWQVKPGQSFPPDEVLPAYIEVVVSTAINKSGDTVFGNIACGAILQVDHTPPYGAVPGQDGYGTITAVNGDCSGVFPKPAVITATQQQKSLALPGEKLSVDYNIANQGATDATGVVLNENFDQVTPSTGTANLGTIAVGATASGSFPITVPAIGPRQASETTVDYASRLAAQDGRLFSSEGEITFTDPFSQLYTPVDVSSFSQLTLPRLTAGLSGPTCIAPNTTLPYQITLENVGSSTASQIAATLTLPDSTTATPLVPDLTAGTRFVGTVNWNAPGIAPKAADETTDAYLTRLHASDGITLPAAVLSALWQDALANAYGPIEQPFVTLTQRIPVVSTSTPATQALLPNQKTQLSFGISNTGTGNAVQVTLQLKRPDGSIFVPPNFSLPGGQSTTATANYQAPALTPKGSTESDADYINRLQALNNTSLNLDAILSWTDPAQNSYGPTDNPFTATEHAPIVTITLAAPANANSGDTITYAITLANIGQAEGTVSNLAITLPDGSVRHPALSSNAIAPGAGVSTNVNFAIDPNHPNGTVAATATVAWTDSAANSYGPLSSSASTQVTLPNIAPVVSAGTNQTVPFPNNLPLQGSVTDDGKPVGGQLTSTWTQVSGPSQAVFADPHNPQTTVTLSAEGSYVLRLTGDDSQLQSSAEVTITTFRGNQPPVVTVGPAQTITLPVNTVNLTGSATDDGLPAGSTLTYSWTKVVGPGTVTFGNASSPSTTAAFSTAGSYVLRLTVSDSQLTSSADVQITVVPHNNPPVANAGPSQTIFLPTTSVTLVGTASDDGLPAGSTLTTLWSLFTGPGMVTFADASSLGTTAIFSTAGVYVLRLTATDSVFTVHSDVTITLKPANLPPLVNAGANQTIVLPSNVSTLPLVPTLVPISTGFNNPIAADYHQPTNKVVMSVNYSGGQPYNFELVAQDGSRTQFSNIKGLTDEVYIASARDEVNGHSIGGFAAGEMFTGSGVGGVVVRISPDGKTVQNPWVTLPGESGLLRGQLYIDRTGTFGGDLIIATTTGNIWRVTSAGVAKKLANVGVPPEGLITIPNDPEHYGPWAGKILAGSENSGRLFAIDTENVVTVFDLNIFAEHIKLVNPNENYFGVDFGSAKLWGLPAAELAGMVNDILIGEESPGNLWQVHWNGTRFEATRFAQVAQWEGATMAPAGIVQVASTTASVTLNGTVSDDGLPVGGTLTSLWSKVSGPGTVTFTSLTTPVTTASFSQPGVYVLRLSATDSELTSTSDVTITISANTAPVVKAGPSQEITLPSTADLTGTITDDGLPAGGTLSSFWTKVIGPGSVSFSTPSFDGTDNFSAVSNPSGLWTYGSTPTRGGVFTPYAFTGQVAAMPAWFKTAPTSGPTFPLLAYNNTATSVVSGGLNIPAQTLLLHPGPSGENSVLRFTAPADASYLVQGRFYGVDNTTTDVSILLNSSTTLLAGSITARNVGVPFTFVKPLKAGDKVDFSVGFGNGNNSSDSTGLQVIVTQAGSTSTTASFNSPGDYVLRLIGSDSELFSFADTHVHVATPCISPASGLVGWWPGDGDTRDLANGNAGVVEDGVVFIPGMVGQAFSLNGGAADVVVPASTALNVRSFTMDAWVFPLDMGVQRPIMEYSSTNGTFGVHLWENLNSSVQVTAGSVYANIVDSGGGSHIISSGGGALQNKRWNHVALTYDQATGVARIFINGAFAAGLTLGTFTPRTNLPLYIGARPNSNHFLGNIDEPQVYNRALSPAEILAIYTAGNAGNCKPAGTQAPIVSAGIDHTITLPNTQVTLNGTATDPNGAQLSIAWSVDSGAGPVTFANPASATTDATFTNAGVYVVRLTASNSQQTASSVATITVVIPPNTAPVVDAGPDQVTQFPDNFVTLNGSVTDDGLPLGSTVTQQWSKLTGPGSVTFSNPTLAVTQATFSTVGTYTLKLTASDSQLSTSDIVSVTVNPATNQPPAVNAGPDQTVSLPGVVLLNGTVTDDGLPNGSLSIAWKLISGPGAVIFSNPAAAATKATFSATGSYVLQLSASDTQFTTTANLTVTVTDPSIPNDNLPPVVNAGADQSIVLPQNSANLNGTVSDDGFPSGGSLSQFWSMISGPGKVTFANPESAATTAAFSAVGTYVLRLTASDSELSSSSDVTIRVSSTATAGGVFITGHDPDGHAWRGDNGTGAQHILQRSVSYVTAGKANPRILLVASLIPVPSDADPRPGLDISGFSGYDVADDGTAGVPTLDLRTVDFANYDVIIIGSGILQSELDLLNLRASELSNFVNTGGGIVALSEGGGHGNTSHDRFAFLPFNISPVPFNQDEFLFDLTPDGEALGLSAFDVNFNASHDIFQSSGGLKIIDTDSAGNIISLAQRGLLIGLASINKPPQVSAGADQTLQLPTNTVTLAGLVTDDGLPSGSTLSVQWSQVSGPAAVAFANGAQAQTQATFTTPGVYVLRLTASDSQLFTTASVRVTVRSSTGNQAPKVSAGTDQTINSASTFLNGAVTDDGLPAGGALTSTWSVASGPGSVTFINPASPATQVVFGASGTYFLLLTASDSELSSSDVVKIVVTAAVNLAPVVSTGGDQSIRFPVSAVTLNGSASDDGLPLGAALSFAWSEISGPAPVTFSNATAAVTQAAFTTPGTYMLQLAVSDSELTGTATAKIIVNPEPVPPPVVSFAGLADGAEITQPTPILGSVSSGSWKLEYSLLDGSGNPTTFVQFASGNTAVTNGTLGIFDPTMLLNGQYIVRFSSTDSTGQTATASSTVDVSRSLKVGNFTLSFNDLSVPLPGLPITVTRTYDSRDKRVGDFGVGWTLGVANVRVQKTGGAIGQGWDEEVQWSGFFPTYCLQPVKNHVVTITFSDQKVYKFKAVSTPQCQQLLPIDVPQIGFTQISTGSSTAGATLTPIGDTDLLLDGGIPGPVNIITAEVEFADFTQFQLTTAEGFTYILDQKLGATSVTDRNGNTLSITSAGVISSTGQSVSFTRDAQNRITRITDPNGAAMIYQYNGAGDLAAFTDRTNLTTTFAYDGNHLLTDIIDPRGVRVVKSVYDESGRLVSTTDANGNTLTLSHDLAARHETITDRAGNATLLEYDDDGNVVRETDALGNVQTATFDANDNKLTQTDALGRTSSFTYDALGNRLTETDPLGHTTRYTYNTQRQALTITDPLGRVTTNTYDSNGSVLSTKDASGNSKTFTYNGQGLPLTIKDALGNTTSFVYDGAGRVTQATDALGNTSNLTYDSNGNKLTQAVTRTTAGGLRETLTAQFEYDGSDRLVKTTRPDGSSMRTVYNAIGKQSDTFDALNRQTHFEYDDQGRLSKTTYPDGTSESTTYDANDRRLTTTDRAGRTTSFTYDVLGRLTATTYPDGSSVSTVYDAAGQPLKKIDALGNVTQYAYDNAGRRVSMRDAAGNVTTFSSDAANNRSGMTDALGHTTQYVYDSLNRQIQTVFPDGTKDSITYDVLGRQIAGTDQAGKVTQYGYDSVGRLTSVTDALNQITRYSYDEVGNRITQTDANNHNTTFAYDQLGRRIGRTLPAGMNESYTYDLAGNLASKTDFNGHTTTYAYDSLNRLTSRTADVFFVDTGAGASQVSFTYTNTGRRASMTDASGTTTYTYDNRDRLLTKATPFGTLTYTYDAAGNILSTTSSNANGAAMTNTYDALNRLASVTDASGVTSYSYDAVGNLAGYAYPNGISTSYTYSPLNRLTQMQSTCGSGAGCGTPGAPIARYAYTLGATGNRLSVAELSGRTVQYGHDDLYRLTSETISGTASQNGTVGYSYDSVGNRLQRSSTLPAVPATGLLNYDANDRVSTDPYDNNGNLLNAGTGSNVYDFENRLVQSGGVNIVYDGDGNRVSETVAGQTTAYLVDSNNLTGYAQVVEEIQGTAVVRTYSLGMERINERQIIGGAPRTSFYGYDGHGSVRFLTDQSGAITDTYDYDAFGNLLAFTGATPNNYLFAGEEFDPALGIYYNRARFYDQRAGRFWTMDTYEGQSDDPISLHKYLYASNDPTDRVDPSGNQDTMELGTAMAVMGTLTALTMLTVVAIQQHVFENVAIATTGIAAEIYGEFSSAAEALIVQAELAVSTTYRSLADAIEKAKEKVKDTYRRLKKKLQDFKVVPIPEDVIPTIYGHVLGAIPMFGFALTRTTGDQARLNRAACLTSHGVRYVSAGPGMSWDEYPFASSLEGGAGCSVMAVPLYENLVQGGIIAASYMLENITVGDEYFVVPLPHIPRP